MNLLLLIVVGGLIFLVLAAWLASALNRRQDRKLGADGCPREYEPYEARMARDRTAEQEKNRRIADSKIARRFASGMFSRESGWDSY